MKLTEVDSRDSSVERITGSKGGVLPNVRSENHSDATSSEDEEITEVTTSFKHPKYRYECFRIR